VVLQLLARNDFYMTLCQNLSEICSVVAGGCEVQVSGRFMKTNEK